MKIQNSEFVKSCVKIEDCPTDHVEFAFIGRSNVGKSSLINMLTNRKKLAKTSSKPGKTQTINYFLINYLWFLVDLPGYGYAKTSKTNRTVFEKIIKNYIFKSPNLINLFILIDASLPPQKIDLDFINLMGMNQIPLSLIFTKIDKISKQKLAENVQVFNNALLESWEAMPKFFKCSAINQSGKEELISYIDEVLKIVK